MDTAIALLYEHPRSVLTTDELALVWQEPNRGKLNEKINYYIKRGGLIRLRRGIFAKKTSYDKRELAVSIYKPSYISFETVLRDAGMIFQHYDTIFMASQISRATTVMSQTYVFRKIKDEALYTSAGILNSQTYSIATPERAFLDMIYLFPRTQFDNLHTLKWNTCFELVKLYKNKSLERRLVAYKNQYA